MNRAVDVALAGLGLVVASPLLAAAALAVKLEDGGPVLFRQTRVGKGGGDFELLKLRSMVVDAERQGAGYAVDRGDARITRVGRVMRRTSVDELPQLWNVVRGDMSVIGPRPTLRYQVERYTERQRRRLEVKPGLTGWAQIKGRATLPWADRIELDVWYVEHRSPLVDLKILLRTPLALFGARIRARPAAGVRRRRSRPVRVAHYARTMRSPDSRLGIGRVVTYCVIAAAAIVAVRNATVYPAIADTTPRRRSTTRTGSCSTGGCPKVPGAITRRRASSRWAAWESSSATGSVSTTPSRSDRSSTRSRRWAP